MHIRRRSAREVLLGAAVVGVVVTLVGCTALPRGTLDPLTPVLGLPRVEKAAPQAPVSPGAPDAK